MLSRKKLIAGVASIALIGGLVACSESAPTGTEGGGDVILIGAALPLTGGLSPEGEKQRNGIELWAKATNDAGGIDVKGEKRKVELKFYDYESDTDKAVSLVTKLITEDGVEMIMGPLGSGATKAVSTVTERYKVPMVANSASSAEVYDQGYNYLWGVLTPNESITDPLVDLAASQTPAIKTMAILSRNDLFPLAVSERMEAAALAKGIKVVAFEQFPIGQTSFSSVLSSIKDRSPDWIFVSGYTEDLVPITKQMKELRITAPMISQIAGPEEQLYIDSLGEAANGVSSSGWWHNSVAYEGVDIFGTAENYSKMYKDAYGEAPAYGSAASSMVGVVFAEAIKACGCTDAVGVNKAIDEMDIVTFFGPMRFGDNGQNDGLEAVLFQIQNGKVEVIAPKEIQTSTLDMPAWK